MTRDKDDEAREAREEKAWKEKQERWKRKDDEVEVKGTRVKRTLIPLPPGKILCDLCFKPVELIKSTFGTIRVSTGMVRRVGKRDFIHPVSGLITVETLGESKYPKMRQVRVCEGCVGLLEQATLPIPDRTLLDPDKLFGSGKSGKWKTWRKI